MRYHNLKFDMGMLNLRSALGRKIAKYFGVQILIDPAKLRKDKGVCR